MTIHLKKRELFFLLVLGLGFGLLSLLLMGRRELGLAFIVCLGVLVSVAFSLELYLRVFVLNQGLVQEFRQVQALTVLVQTLKPVRPLPPLRGWAVTPDLGLMLVSAVFEENPLTIVECGSGSSTLLMAYVLRELGAGHIFSLEHDVPSKERTEAMLRRHGVDDRVTVLHAPLCEHSLNGEKFQWYDTSSLPSFEAIDLVFVDGPPSFRRDFARYPALPTFWPKLRSGGLVFLDDSARPGERRVVERWKAEFPAATYRVEDTQKGTVVLRKS